MPKRSNAFQKLVLALKKHYAGGARVEESMGLLNAKTGKEQEVDICVVGEIAGDSLIVSVESKEGGRSASVEWVQRMLGKHADLPTNLLVLAHSTGFSKPARTLDVASTARRSSSSRPRISCASTPDSERSGSGVEGITIHEVTTQDDTLQGSTTISDRSTAPAVPVSLMPREDTRAAFEVLMKLAERWGPS
jgi:hypothetical protein